MLALAVRGHKGLLFEEVLGTVVGEARSDVKRNALIALFVVVFEVLAPTEAFADLRSGSAAQLGPLDAALQGPVIQRFSMQDVARITDVAAIRMEQVQITRLMADDSARLATAALILRTDSETQTGKSIDEANKQAEATEECRNLGLSNSAILGAFSLANNQGQSILRIAGLLLPFAFKTCANPPKLTLPAVNGGAGLEILRLNRELASLSYNLGLLDARLTALNGS